jgi:hypothetical protein
MCGQEECIIPLPTSSRLALLYVLESYRVLFSEDLPVPVQAIYLRI